MIIWLPRGLSPSSKSLEKFLFAFRVKSVAEAILNGCDVAVMPVQGLSGQVNLVIPRDPGTLKEVVAGWHLNVSPHYPYTDVVIGPSGFTGLTDTADGFMRFRILPQGLEAIDVAEEDYAWVVSSLVSNHYFDAWFVSQPDSTLRFQFKPPEPGIKHEKLSLEMTYHPDEYLIKPRA